MFPILNIHLWFDLGLHDVLLQKYNLSRKDATELTDFLLPMLSGFALGTDGIEDCEQIWIRVREQQLSRC